MAVKFRDYYEILGVARDAKEEDIKKTYRKLARKYHPDSNPGDAAAEAKFKEISEAHSVLADPEQRKEYDQVVELWLAPRMDYAPVRLRLTNPNGDTVDQRWSSTDKG